MRKNIKIALLLSCLMVISALNSYAQSLCHCRIPLDNTFNVAPMTQGPDVGVPPLYENYDAATPAMALPFHFCFYGQTYDSVYIGNKGIVTFKKPIYVFDTSARFPFGADTVMIAPFYSDAYTLGNGGVVYYKMTSTSMIVIWDSLRYRGTDVDGWNTFQLIITDGSDPILPAGNNVSFCYPVMQWACSDSAGGFSGYGGSPATVGVNKGDGVTFAQVSTFSHPGDFYYGPFSPYNGVDWLDFENFTFNTCVQGNTIAPVIYGYTASNSTFYICPCDTTSTESALGATDSVLVQACDTVSITGAFICAGAGQTANLSYSCEGPLYIYSVDTSTVNFIDSMTVRVIPVFSDTGDQVLTITATDPVSHLQSTVTYKIVVTVNCLDSIPPPITGIAQTSVSNDISVYPNPANKNFTLKVNDSHGFTAKLYDVLGKQVLVTSIVSVLSDVDVSGLSKGVYFFKLFKGDAPVAVKKLIIQ